MRGWWRNCHHTYEKLGGAISSVYKQCVWNKHSPPSAVLSLQVQTKSSLSLPKWKRLYLSLRCPVVCPESDPKQLLHFLRRRQISLKRENNKNHVKYLSQISNLWSFLCGPHNSTFHEKLCRFSWKIICTKAISSDANLHSIFAEESHAPRHDLLFWSLLHNKLKEMEITVDLCPINGIISK